MSPSESTLCLLVLGSLSLTLAGPIINSDINSQSQCTSTCTESNKFQYETGKRYLYEYSTTVESSVLETTDESSEVNFRATVAFDVVSKCNWIMKLSNVLLEPKDVSGSGVPNQEMYRTELERYTLNFAFQDGKIEKLCANSNDPSWVLNIKRGILSTFQNSMDNFNSDENVVETDVTGKCTSYYTIKSNERQKIVGKKKDLLECDSHMSHNGPIHAHSYISSSNKKSLTLMKSTHTCEQKILDGKLITTECLETHKFKPFSNNYAGATAVIKQMLKFTDERNVNQFEQYGTDNMKVLSLLFDSTELQRPADQKKAEQLFKELCLTTEHSVQSTTPELFSAFVQQLKKLHLNQLKNFNDKIKTICPDNSQRRKLFLDGMQMAISSDSVTFMTTLIQEGELSEMEANTWFLSLAFIQNPTKSMIAALSNLLDENSPKQKAMLGVSALIHTYCDSNEKCASEPEVKLAIQKIKNVLKEDCQIQSDEDKTNKMVAIKALGNAGAALNSAKPLIKCFNKESPTEVRVAAVEALRRISCSKKVTQMWNLYSNFEEDSEVRIAAFKVLMQCPTPELIEKIEEVLNREDTNQVGSYVWTYLTNVQESVDPCKNEIRNLLYSHILKKKFSTDIRKFSQNLEGSLHSETMNMGIHTEADVIFSPKSYLPRSGLLNITVDMFDKTINLFEVGGRIEGFEHFVESLVSAGGIYPEATLETLLRSLREKHQIDKDSKKQSGENIDSQPQASMYLRIFGNDLHYTSFSPTQTAKKDLSLVDLFHQLVMKEEIDVSKNFIFLDSSIKIPTSAGFPLILAVNGSASIRMEMKGHLDLVKILSGNCNISATLRPSAAIKVSGTMSVDTYHTKSGIKLESTMHTSTAANAKIILKGKKMTDIQIEIPQDKMEIFHISSELFLIKGEETFPLKGIENNKIQMKKCSGAFSSKVFGFELCTELLYPNASLTNHAPFFPLTGPSKATLVLKRTDPTLTHFKFTYQDQNHEDNQHRFAHQFLIDTPGSTINRKLAGGIVFNTDDYHVKAHLITPWKNFNLEGKVDFNAKDRLRPSISLDGSIEIDHEKVLSILLEKKYNWNTYVREHLLNLEYRGTPIVTLNGSLSIPQSGELYDIKYSLQHLTTEPIEISGRFFASNRKPSNRRFQLYLALDSTYINGQLQFSFQQSQDNIASQLNLKRRGSQQQEISYDLIFNLEREFYANQELLRAKVELRGNSLSSLAATWEYNHQENYLKNQLDLSRGDGDTKKTASLVQIFKYTNYNNIHNYSVEIVADCALCKTKNSQLFLNYQYNDEEMKAKAILEFGYGKQFQNIMSQKYPFFKNVPSASRIEFSTGLKLRNYDYEGYLTFVLPDGQRYHTQLQYQFHEENADKYYSGSLQLESPRIIPFTVTVNLQTGSQFSLKSVLELGNHRLSLDSSYFVSDDNHKINIDFESLGHHFSNELRFSIKDKNINVVLSLGADDNWQLEGNLKFIHNGNHYENFVGLKWDSFDSSSKEYYASCDLIKLNNGYDLKIKGKFLNSKIDLLLSTKTDGSFNSPSFTHSSGIKFQVNDIEPIKLALDINSVTNNPRRETYARISVAIPFSTTYKKYALMITLKEMQQEWEANATFQENDVEIFNTLLTLLLENFESNPHLKLDFQIHLPEVPPFHILTEFTKIMHEIKLNVELQIFSHNKRKFLLHGNAFDGPFTSNIIGSVNLTVTENLQYIGDFRLVRNGENIKIESKIGKNNKLFTISGDVNIKEKERSIVAVFYLTTPFKEFNEIKTTARYNFDGSNLNTYAEVIWRPDKRIALEAVGSLQQTVHSRNFVGTLQLTSVNPAIDLLLTLTHEQSNFQIKDNIEIKWEGKEIINLKTEGSLMSWNEVKFNIIFACPEYLVEQLEVKFSFLLREQLDVMLEISVDDDKYTFEVNGVTERQDSKITNYVSATVTTPLRKLSKLHINLYGLMQENQLEGKAEVKTDDLSYSLIFSGFINDELNFGSNITVITANNEKREFSIYQKTQHSWRGFNITHNTNVILYSDKNYNIYGTANINFSKGVEIESEVKFSTPVKIYGPLQVKLTIPKHNYQYNYWYVKLTYAKIGFDFELFLNDVTQGQGIINGGLITSIPGMEYISLSTKYSLAKGVFTSQSELQHNSQQWFEMKVSSRHLLTQAKVQIKSSNLFQRKIDFDLEYDFNSDTRSVFNLRTVLDDQQLSFETTVDLHKGYFNLVLLTPFHGYENFTVNVRVDLPNINKILNLVLQKNDKKIQAGGQLTIINNQLNFHGNIQTPYNGYKNLTAEIFLDFNHQGDERLRFTVNSENREIELKGTTYSKNLNQGQFVLSLISEYLNVNAGIKMEKNFESQVYNLNTHIYHNSNIIKIDYSYFVDKNEMTIKMRTPWEKYESLLLRITGNYEDGKYKANIIWEKNYEKKIIILESGEKENAKEFLLSILNYDQPVFVFAASCAISAKEKKLNIRMQVHDQLASLHVKYNNEYLQKSFEVYFNSNFTSDHMFETKGYLNIPTSKTAGEINLSITSSLLNYKIYSLECNFHMESKEVHLKVILDKSLYELNAKLNEQELIKQLFVDVSTPIQGFENLNITAEWKKANSEKQLKVTFSLSDITTELRGKMKIEDKKSRMELSAQTPYKGYEYVNVSGEHDFTDSEKIVAIKMESGDSNIQLRGIATMNNEGGRVTLNIISNYENYKEVKIDGLYVITMYNVKGKFYIQNGERRSDLVFAITNAPTVNDLSIQFTSPFKNYENLGLTYSSTKETKERSTVASIWWNTVKKITYKGKIDFTASGYTGKINIITPFSGFESTIISMHYNTLPHTKAAEISLYSNGNKLAEVKGEINKYQDKNFIKLDVYPPFKGYQSMQLTTRSCNNYNEQVTDTESHMNGVSKSDSKETEDLWICRHQMSIEFALASTVSDGSMFVGIKYHFTDKTPSFGIFSFQKGLDKINIEISNDFQSIGGSFHLTSTYVGFEKFSLEWKYIPSGDKKEIMFKSEWKDKKLDLSAFLVQSKDLVNAEVHLDTPFKGIQNLDGIIKLDLESPKKEASVNLNYNKEQYGGTVIIRTQEETKEPVFTAALMWGHDEKITLNLIKKTENKAANYQLILTTPLKICETNYIKFSYDYKNIRNSFISFVSNICSSNSEMSASLLSDSTKTSAKISGKNLLFFPSLGISFDYNSINEHKLKIDFYWGEHTATLYGFMKIQADITTQLQITSSFKNFKNFKFTFDFIRSLPKKIISIFVKLPKGKGYQLRLEGKTDSQNQQYNVFLKTPFQKFEEFSINAVNQFTSQGLKGFLAVDLNKKIPFKLVWNVTENQILASMQSPFAQLKIAGFSANFNFKNENKLLNANLDWNGNNKIEAIFNLKNNLPATFLMNFNVKTTFSSFPETSFTITHSWTNVAINSEISLITPIKKFQKTIIKLISDYSRVNLMVEAMTRNLIISGKLMQNLPYDLQVDLTFTSNIISLPQTSISACFKNSDWQKLNTFLQLTLNQQKGALIQGSFFVQDEKIYTEISLESPYLGNNPFSFESNISFTSTNVNILSNLLLDVLYTFQVDLSYNDENIQGKVKINSEKFENKEIMINVNLNKNKQTKFSYSSGTTSHEVIGYISTDHGIQGLLQFNSNALSIKSITFNYIPGKSNLNAEITITDTSSVIHKFFVNSNWTDSNANGKIIIETPWKQIDKLTLQGRIQKKNYIEEIFFSAETPHSVNVFNGKLFIEENNLLVQLTIQMPMIGNKFLQFTLLLSDTEGNRGLQIILKTDQVVHMIKSKYFSDSITHQGQLEITTPFFNIKTVIIDFVYMNSEYSDIELILKINRDKQVHTLSGKIHHHLKNLRVEALVESAILSFRKLVLAFNMNTANKDAITCVIKIEINRDIHELIINTNWIRPSFSIEIQLKSTVISPLSIKGNFNYVTGEKIELVLDLEKTTHKLILKLYSIKMPLLNIELQLDTPLYNIGSLSTGLKIDMSNTEFWGNSVEAFVKTPQSQKTLIMTSFKQNDVTGIEIKFEDPESKLMVFSFGFSLQNQTGYIQLSLGDHKLKLNGSIYSSNDHLLKLSLRGNHSYKDIFREVNVTVDCKYEKSSGIFNAKFELSTLSQSQHLFSIQVIYKPGNRRHDITINIQTPYTNYEVINLYGKVSYNRALTEAISYFSFTLPNKKYSINGEYNRKNHDHLITVTINDSKQFQIMLKLEPKYYKLQMKISTSTEEYFTASLSCKLRKDNVILNGHFKHLDTSWSLDINIAPKQFLIKEYLNRQKFNIHLTLKNNYGQVLAGGILFNINRSKNMILTIQGQYFEEVYSFNLKAFHEDKEKTFNSNQQSTNKTFALELKLNNIMLKGSITIGNKDILFRFASSFAKLTSFHLSLNNGILIEVNSNRQHIVKLQATEMHGTKTYAITIFDRTIEIVFSRIYGEGTTITKGNIFLESKYSEFPPITFELKEHSDRDQRGVELVLQLEDNTAKITTLDRFTDVNFSTKYGIQWKFGQKQQEVSYESSSEWNPNKRHKNISYKLNLLSRQMEYSIQINHDNGLQIDTTFKWDALRDPSRLMRTKFLFKQEYNGGYIFEFLLHHPKLETDLMVHGHITFNEKNTIFSSHFDVKYSADEDENFKMDLNIKKDSNNDVFVIESKAIHSPSTLNLQFLLEIINNTKERSLKINLNSLSKDSIKFEISGKILKEEKQVDFQVKCDDAQLKITTKAVSNSEECRAYVIATLNNYPPATIHLQFKKAPLQLLMNIVYNTKTQEQIILDAGMPTEKEIQLDLFKGDNINKYNLIHLSAVLENSRLLNSSFSWSPEHLLQSVDEVRNINPLLEQVTQFTQQKMERIENEGAKLKNVAVTAFDQTARFISDDISDFIVENIIIIDELFNSLKDDKLIQQFLIPFIIDAFERLHISTILSGLDDCIPIEQIKIIYNKLLFTWKAIISSIGNMDQMLDNLYVLIRDYTQDAYKVMYVIRRKIVLSVIDFIQSNFVKVGPLLKAFGKTMIEWTQNYIFLITNYITELVMNQSIGDLLEKYYEQITEATNNLLASLNYPQWKSIFSFVKLIYTKIETLILDESTQSHLQRFYTNAQNEIFYLAYNIITDHPIINVNTTYEIHWDPDKNQMDYIQHLPVDWESFTETPYITDSLITKNVLNWINRIIYRIQNIQIKNIVEKSIPKIIF